MYSPSRSLRPWAQRLLVAAAGLTSLTACDQQIASVSDRAGPPPNIAPYVVPDLAAELNAKGQFVLPAPPPAAFPQINAERARELAIVFVRTFGPNFRPTWEREHGAPIDFDQLTADSRVFYGASPYRPLPAHIHPGIRMYHGPYYFVTLKAGAIPVLSVAVSAYTKSWVENGRMRFPVEYGGDMLVWSVSADEGPELPVSPERAVQIVGSTTSARADAIPELILPSVRYFPQYARWKVTLDRPVQARGKATGRVFATREVYVGRRGEIEIPLTEQPDRVTAPNVDGSRIGVDRVPSRPLNFEPAHLSASGGRHE